MALKLTVTIDGKPVTVEVKPADYVRLEEHDADYAKEVAVGESSNFTLRRQYILAWVALARAKRRGLVEVEVGSLDDFLDAVDVIDAENSDPKA